MTVTLKIVARDDVRPLCALKVSPDQQAFVAPNDFSLAQVHYETGATPYGIWDQDRPVGFCQVIDMRAHEFREPEDDPEAMYLWRLMIGVGHQGRGYGQAAMRILFETAKAAGHKAFETSVVAENDAAMAFYTGLGFTQTGRMVDGEVQLRVTL